MLTKLAVLYTLMNNYTIKLSKEHSLNFLKMIRDTKAGEAMIMLSTILRKLSDEWETIFFITSREDAPYVVIVVDKLDRFIPFMKPLEAVEKILNSYGFKLEMEIEKNFSKTELLPF